MKDLTIKKCNEYIAKFEQARTKYNKGDSEYGELTEIIDKYKQQKAELQGETNRMNVAKKLLDIHED